MTIKQLRSKCDKLWFGILIYKHPRCEVCGVETQQIHHYWHKGSYGHLRYDLDNGIGLCMKHHSVLHFRDAKTIESIIIEKRGEKWNKELLLRARSAPTSFKNVSWYKSKIEILEAIYNKL